MTSCSALERTDDVARAQSGALEQIASVWAVLVTLETLPASSNRKDSLVHTRQRFRQRLEAARISEAELPDYLEQLFERRPQSFERPPPPTLRLVRN